MTLTLNDRAVLEVLRDGAVIRFYHASGSYRLDYFDKHRPHFNFETWRRLMIRKFIEHKHNRRGTSIYGITNLGRDQLK